MTFLELKERNELIKKQTAPPFRIELTYYDEIDDIVYLSNGAVLDSVSQLAELIMEDGYCIEGIDQIKDWEWFDTPYRTEPQIKNIIVDKQMVATIEAKISGMVSLTFSTVDNLIKAMYNYQEWNYDIILDYANFYAMAIKDDECLVFSDLNFKVVDADRLFESTPFTSIDLSMVDFDGITSLDHTFTNCDNLKYVDIFNVEGDVNMVGCFDGCPKLEVVNAKGIKAKDNREVQIIFGDEVVVVRKNRR